MNIIQEPHYLLVTPAKNEETFIGDLIESVRNQSVKPALWVIVDDGSTDATVEILEKKTSGEDWIEVLHLPQGERMRGQHYAYVCKQGFDEAIKKVREWDYIGLVDADMILEEKYFEKLINEFEKNNRLGIISGGMYYRGKLEIRKEDHAFGGCRLFRQKCFEDIGGYIVYPSKYAAADTISNAKARLKGWDLCHFPDIRVEHRRPTAPEGAWRAGYRNARFLYYYDAHPLILVGAFFSHLLTNPFYHAIPFASGCFLSYLFRYERIPDDEIKNYYRKLKLKEIKLNPLVYLKT